MNLHHHFLSRLNPDLSFKSGYEFLSVFLWGIGCLRLEAEHDYVPALITLVTNQTIIQRREPEGIFAGRAFGRIAFVFLLVLIYFDFIFG